jgi:hypothetical protein
MVNPFEELPADTCGAPRLQILPEVHDDVLV